jgi:hypothetical protein
MLCTFSTTVLVAGRAQVQGILKGFPGLLNPVFSTSTDGTTRFRFVDLDDDATPYSRGKCFVHLLRYSWYVQTASCIEEEEATHHILRHQLRSLSKKHFKEVNTERKKMDVACWLGSTFVLSLPRHVFENGSKEYGSAQYLA